MLLFVCVFFILFQGHSNALIIQNCIPHNTIQELIPLQLQQNEHSKTVSKHTQGWKEHLFNLTVYYMLILGVYAPKIAFCVLSY